MADNPKDGPSSDYSKMNLANQILESYHIPIEDILTVSKLYIDQALELFAAHLKAKIEEDIKKEKEDKS